MYIVYPLLISNKASLTWCCIGDSWIGIKYNKLNSFVTQTLKRRSFPVCPWHCDCMWFSEIMSCVLALNKFRNWNWKVTEVYTFKHLSFCRANKRKLSKTKRNSPCRGHGRSLYVEAPTNFLRRDERDLPDKHQPSGWDHRCCQGDGSPTFLGGNGRRPVGFASLFLLLCGDVETNPGPSCYACGQNRCAGGVWKWEHGCSVNGGNGERHLSRFSPTFSLNHW